MSQAMIKKTALTAALVLLALPTAAARLSMVTEGSFSGISGWDPNRRSEDNIRSVGGELNLYLQPMISFKGDRWLISPNYDFRYSSVNNVIAVDENIYLYNQYMSNLFELGGAWRSRDGQRLGLKLFHTAVNGTTATNEKLSTGLYNYNDTGAKASWSRKTASLSNYSIGLSAYSRKYPHYVSLDPEARHEKDANIIKASADAEINWKTKTPFMSLLSYSIQSIRFTDAYIINATGTTNTAADGSGTLRRDLVHKLGLTFPFEAGKSKWGIGYSLEVRDSNFFYLDSAQFVEMDDYNDYAENGLLLSIAYGFDGPWWILKSPEISLDADVHYRMYNSRKARQSDGTLDDLAPLQTDNRYQARIGLNSPVSEHWSVNTSIDFLGVSSNNLDTSTSLVNYKFYTLRAGAQFNY